MCSFISCFVELLAPQQKFDDVVGRGLAVLLYGLDVVLDEVCDQHLHRGLGLEEICLQVVAAGAV